MAESEDLAREASERFRGAADLCLEDAEARRLRYHLRRLTLVGLTDQDVKDLVELGRLAFQDADLTKKVTTIKRRADASPLALAIVNIVDPSGGGVRGPARPKALLFGAVLGAYTGLGQPNDTDQLSSAVLGAIGGAVAMSTSAFVEDHIDEEAWSNYLKMKD